MSLYICPNPWSTAPRVNPKVNCGLWVIMIRQYRFILVKECIILLSDVDNGSYAHVGTEGIWKISLPSSQFWCKPQTALKNSLKKKMVMKLSHGVMKLKGDDVFCEQGQYLAHNKLAFIIVNSFPQLYSPNRMNKHCTSSLF